MQLQHFKSIPDQRTCRLRGIAVAPMRDPNPVANFGVLMICIRTQYATAQQTPICLTQNGQVDLIAVRQS